MQLTLTINYEATKARLVEIINSVPCNTVAIQTYDYMPGVAYMKPNAGDLADKLIQCGVLFLSEDTLKEFIQQVALKLLISTEANKASYLKVQEPKDMGQLQALWRTFGASVCAEQKVIGITLKNQEGK